MPTSGMKTKLRPMDRDAIERARIRLAAAGDGGREDAALEALLERARAGLEALAVTTAELETGMPDRLESALQQGLREEVLPVARHLAELRCLSDQKSRKMLYRAAGPIPGPESDTLTAILQFSAASSSATRPPSGVHANALSSRLDTTCSTRSPS